MKMIRLLSVFLMVASIFVFAPSGVAANKADRQKQPQQKKVDKKQIKQNKNFYKNIEKPILKQQKAKNKQLQKQAKQERKQASKNLDNSYQEVVKFSKAKNGAKAVLLKQHQQMQAAIKNYNDNPSPKTLNARDKLIASYKNSYKNYQEGPKQRWLNKVNAFDAALKNFDSKDKGYKKALEQSAKIARDKIKAKAAIKNSKQPVEARVYDIVPSISLSAKVEPLRSGSFKSTGSLRDQIYGPGPASLPIYDRVSDNQMLDYAKAPVPLQFSSGE